MPFTQPIFPQFDLRLHELKGQMLGRTINFNSGKPGFSVFELARLERDGLELLVSKLFRLVLDHYVERFHKQKMTEENDQGNGVFVPPSRLLGPNDVHIGVVELDEGVVVEGSSFDVEPLV